MKLMKTIKKSISILLVGTITVTSLSTAAFGEYEAFDKESITMKIHKEMVSNFTGSSDDQFIVKHLYDLNGNVFELVETGEKGYYIFDSVSGKYLEMAPETPSPYLGLNQDIYYFGPMNYYHKVDGIFKHNVLPDTYDFPEELTDEVQKSFDTALCNSRAVKDEEMLSLISRRNVDDESIRTKISSAYAASDDVYIPNYHFIKDDPYPANTGDTCGYVAACIILSYWNRVNVIKGKNRIIERSFLTSDGTLSTTGYTLQDELLSYGYSHSSTGKLIRDVIIDYCNDYGISATATYYLGNWEAAAELGRGRPIILFGASFPNLGLLDFHAVTAYGLHSENSIIGYFIVNYGWGSGYEHVYLDTGLIGENMQFKLN